MTGKKAIGKSSLESHWEAVIVKSLESHCKVTRKCLGSRCYVSASAEDALDFKLEVDLCTPFTLMAASISDVYFLEQQNAFLMAELLRLQDGQVCAMPSLVNPDASAKKGNKPRKARPCQCAFKRNGSKKNERSPGADGMTLTDREDVADKLAKSLGMDTEIENINERDVVKQYVNVPKEERKTARILLAKAMFPDVPSLTNKEKIQAANKSKAGFKKAICDLGLEKDGDDQIMAPLMKAVCDRLQIEKKQKE